MFLALFASAYAGDLTYQWPEGEALHYRAQVALSVPLGLTLMGKNNLDVQVNYLEYALLLTCTPQAPGKKDQRVDCAIDEAKMLGRGAEREQDEVNELMDEFATRLSAGTIQATFANTGKLKSIDLEGVTKDNQRDRHGYEVLRRLSARAISPLEIEVPKDGEIPDKAWKQKHAYAMSLPNTSSSGVVKIENTAAPGDDGTLVITSAGQGTVADQATYDNPAVNNTTGVILTGSAVFDPARGLVVSSQHRVQGSYTASATSNVGDGLVFDQVAGIELLAEPPTPTE